MFPVFWPYSEPVLNYCLKMMRRGRLIALDVQLGPACNANCKCCDSSVHKCNEPNALNVRYVADLASDIWSNMEDKSMGYIPGFVCGLGEPTAPGNYEKFRSLVEATPNVRWSFFTNGLTIDDWFLEYLVAGRIAPIIQLVSKDAKVIADSMRVSEKVAEQQLNNWQLIMELLADCPSISGNVAASIVPTKMNQDEWCDLIDYAVSNGVFPLVGELEESGEAKGDFFNMQSPDRSALIDFRQWIYEEYGCDYTVPLCPAVLCAIHINNKNEVTVEPEYGFACGWFSMVKVETIRVADSSMWYDEICGRIMSYRGNRRSAATKKLDELTQADLSSATVFGGCGGKELTILRTYLRQT